MKSFKELAKADVSDNKSIVISKNSFGGVTIAQKVVTMDGGREIPIYLKGAFDIEEPNIRSAIINLHDAITKAAEELGIDLEGYSIPDEEEED